MTGLEINFQTPACFQLFPESSRVSFFMKYTSLIDNITAKKWGISIPEAYLFDWIYSLPSWAEKVVISGHDFFFASKTKAITELPLITDKVDTMYRYYRALEERGLIILKKVEGKDYVCLTAKAKEWNRKSEYSEKNPGQVGKKSGAGSEKNPTYKTTSNDNNTIISGVKKTIEEREEDFRQKLVPFVQEYGKELVRKFFDYWTEKNEAGKKMKWEIEQSKRGTFELSKRLATWKKKGDEIMMTQKKGSTTTVKNVKQGTNNQEILDEIERIKKSQAQI